MNLATYSTKLGERKPGLVKNTLNILLKFETDIDTAGEQLRGLVDKARQAAGG